MARHNMGPLALRSLLLLSAAAMLLCTSRSEGSATDPVTRIVAPAQTELFFAWSIANAGDFNGDGYEDLVVYGPSESVPSHARVYFGGPEADSIEDVLLLRDPVLTFPVNGQVASAGDMNGDGFDDIVVLTPSSTFDGGQARVYFGGEHPDGIPDLALREDPGNFFTFPTPNAAATDFNGDGFDDVLLGAPGYEDYTEYDPVGRAYLFLGGPAPDGDPDLILESLSKVALGELFYAFGGIVASTGDLNGDSFGDFLVAPGRGLASPTFWERAYVYLGGAKIDSIPDASMLTGPLLISSFGDQGRPVMTAVGDLNADGFQDVAMIRYIPPPSGSGASSRSVQVYWGNGGMTFDRAPDLVFELPGGLNATSVSGGRDVNGDGRSDLIVASIPGSSVFAYFGGTRFDSVPDMTLTRPPTWFGAGLVLVDWTGDGVSDLVATATLPRVPGEVLIYDLAEPLRARALTESDRRAIAIAEAAPAPLRLRFEPVDGSYASGDVDAASIRLRAEGTGELSEISAITGKSNIEGDYDRNGVPDLLASFAGADLARLFSNVLGRKVVDATLEGRLRSRRRFAAPLSFTIVGTGPRGELNAAVQPNPLNPRGTLSFSTASQGAVTARLFDLHGRCVRILLRGEILAAGDHRIPLDGRDDDGRDIASGVYFYRIDSPDGPARGRLVIAK